MRLCREQIRIAEALLQQNLCAVTKYNKMILDIHYQPKQG